MTTNGAEITVSVKDTETFAKLFESAFEFFAWYNRTHQQPSNHGEHPWCKLGKVLDDLSDRGVLEQELRFKQIECVAVPDSYSPHCSVYMYGLTDTGELWFKTERDDKWTREPLTATTGQNNNNDNEVPFETES